MVLDRYLILEISKPLIAVCTVLVVIFGSYTAAEHLAEAAAGLITGRIVIYLVLLKLAVAMEVLLPFTLYLSIIVALGRMYADLEMTALFSCGVGISRILKAVLYLSVPIALVVASLSLYVRPWAYQRGYLLKYQARASLDISKWKEGNFYEIPRMKRVVYADEINSKKGRAEGVFVYSDRGDKVQVIQAKKVYQKTDERTDNPRLTFVDGHLYEFSRLTDEGHIMKFRQSSLSVDPSGKRSLEDKRKAVPTNRLARSAKPEEIAEFQWRLSIPLATVLLALLAIPLSRTAPRRGKYGKVGVAVLIFAVYYNTSLMAKKWVEQGIVGAMPGLWWVLALLGLLVLVLLIQPNLSFRWMQKKQRVL